MEFSWRRLERSLKVRLPFVIGVVLLSVIITAAVSTPTRRRTGYAPVQPVAFFSHQTHAGTMKIDCRYCHVGVEGGRHATVPATSVCMNCHAVAQVDSTRIAPVLASARSGEPIEWRRVHRLPDYVYFSHDVHIAAGTGCETCHGRVEQMTTVRQVMPMTMAFCLDCHRNAHEYWQAWMPGEHVGPENCGACHR